MHIQVQRRILIPIIRPIMNKLRIEAHSSEPLKMLGAHTSGP